MATEWVINMKLYEVMNIIEKEYPTCLEYAWDNSGLFFGDKNKEINKIMTTLDVTYDIICQAKEEKADLVLSHHPIFISDMKKLSDNSMQSDIIVEAVKNNIAIYSAHTNMDRAKDGINSKLAEIFELSDTEILEIDLNYPDCGLGRCGKLKNETSLYDFCEVVKEKLNTPFVRVCGNDRKIKKIAVASGSCSEYIPLAIEKNCDVIVTADMKYHKCIEFVYDGIAVIDAGHYPTEIIVKDMFAKLLEGTKIEIVNSNSSDIFKVV